MLQRFKFWFLIGAIGLAFYGVEEQKLASAAKPKPTTVTLEQLGNDGIGENAHVVIRDFFLCTWDYVYTEKRGSWVDAWVPGVPLGGEFHQVFVDTLEEDGTWPDDVALPTPSHPTVIFKVTEKPVEESVDRIAGEDAVRGLVINRIESLDSQTRRLLEDSYPLADFESILIFEPGRSPKGAGTIYALFGGAIALGGIGVWLLVTGRRDDDEFEDEGEFKDDEEPVQPASGSVS